MTRDLRVCVFGDSFVNGIGDDYALGWVGRLCAQARAQGHDLTVYDLGIRGETSRQLLKRVEAELAPRLTAAAQMAALFSFGLNDLRPDSSGNPHISVGETADNARQILRRAQRLLPVMMIGPPSLPEPQADARLARMSSALDEVCRSLDVPFLNAHAPLSENVIWLHDLRSSRDGIHPNADGYHELAEIVAGWSAWREFLG